VFVLRLEPPSTLEMDATGDLWAGEQGTLMLSVQNTESSATSPGNLVWDLSAASSVTNPSATGAAAGAPVGVVSQTPLSGGGTQTVVKWRFEQGIPGGGVRVSQTVDAVFPNPGTASTTAWFEPDNRAATLPAALPVTVRDATSLLDIDRRSACRGQPVEVTVSVHNGRPTGTGAATIVAEFRGADPIAPASTRAISPSPPAPPLPNPSVTGTTVTLRIPGGIPAGFGAAFSTTMTFGSSTPASDPHANSCRITLLVEGRDPVTREIDVVVTDCVPHVILSLQQPSAHVCPGTPTSFEVTAMNVGTASTGPGQLVMQIPDAEPSPTPDPPGTVSSAAPWMVTWALPSGGLGPGEAVQHRVQATFVGLGPHTSTLRCSNGATVLAETGVTTLVDGTCLKTTITSSPGQYCLGEPVTFTFTVRNHDGRPTLPGVLQAEVEGADTLSSPSGAAGTDLAAPARKVWRWDFPQGLAAGQSASETATATFTAPGSRAITLRFVDGNFRDLAHPEVMSITADACLSGLFVDIVGWPSSVPAHLSTTPPTPPETFQYQLRARVVGTQTFHHVRIRDQIDPPKRVLIRRVEEGHAGVVTLDGPFRLQWDLEEVAPGPGQTLTVHADPSDNPGSVTNTVTWTASEMAPTVTTATVQGGVAGVPGNLRLTVDPPTVEDGLKKWFMMVTDVSGHPGPFLPISIQVTFNASSIETAQQWSAIRLVTPGQFPDAHAAGQVAASPTAHVDAWVTSGTLPYHFTFVAPADASLPIFHVKVSSSVIGDLQPAGNNEHDLPP
jgi:hypothetical protein